MEFWAAMSSGSGQSRSLRWRRLLSLPECGWMSWPRFHSRFPPTPGSSVAWRQARLARSICKWAGKKTRRRAFGVRDVVIDFLELLQKATSVAMLAFVLSSMLAMGLGLTVSQIIAPLRNARLVVLSLLVNFVLMPLGAVGLAALLRLDQPLGVGLLLLGLAAGAPFLPKLAQIARGNLAF